MRAISWAAAPSSLIAAATLLGAGRPVVLAHAALLVGAEREEMVEVVNTFTRRCASAPDCQADSHLGLSERWSDFRMADSLELERRFVAARS
ncbi:lipoate--protein ligase [Pseudomonas aeruginosa VRFPA09]|nr:lipoate--protein ligase [Pseudomonas aeruginosa VRFPA09]